MQGYRDLRYNEGIALEQIMEAVMSEVVLQINDEITLEKLASLLAPYIAKAEIKEPRGKIWTGRAEWLDTPIKMDSFTPLSREEVHGR
ncbi:hypothetical protein AGMMS50229_19920 [Campylobacterota bacterium]|nr:hypothetical protein AGMMS50229_19920 [Campylobacterota bacterium]